MSYQDFETALFGAVDFTDLSSPDSETNGCELSDETRKRLQADCLSFWSRCYFYFEPGGIDDAQAGHDFWLTRNGHGAGFWDGDVKEPYDDMLTKLSKCYGEIELYKGDDGLAYA